MDAEDQTLELLELDTAREGWVDKYLPLSTPVAGLGNPLVPPFLFHGFLRQSTITMIAADPFVGKTMFLLSMILSLDSGLPLLGRFAPAKAHPVLFLGQDSPTWDYRGCFQKLLRGLGDRVGEPVVSGFPSFMFLNRGWDVTDPSFIPFLQEAQRLQGTRVLMLDTLADFHPFDENSNREMAKLMNIFKGIRDNMGMSVMFTHHNAKLAEAMGYSNIAMPRGAGKISGSSDHILILKRLKTGSVAVSMPKGRGLADLETLTAFEISPGENARGESILTLDPSKTLWDRILAALKEPQNRDAIAASVGGFFPDLTERQLYSRVNNALRSLSRAGLVKSPAYGFWVAAERQKGSE